jgi:hypothetical protein
VARRDVFLVIIGPKWLKDKRLHQPDDFVAIEIAAALFQDIRVIPVLVNGARMPKESELPFVLKALARIQAVEVRDTHFNPDACALIGSIRGAGL